MGSTLLGTTRITVTPDPQGRLVTVGDGKVFGVSEVVRTPEHMEAVIQFLQREVEAWRMEILTTNQEANR